LADFLLESIRKQILLAYINEVQNWQFYEISDCELFETVKALLQASRAFFERCHQHMRQVLSIIGAHSAGLT
jgi:hypothetical protein